MEKTILLIDDDILVRKGLSSSLTAAGYIVEEASNGHEGLRKALELHPDMIIADIMMPVMDGLAMIEELRKDEWGKAAPIMVMSTDDSTPSVNQALQTGVTVYLAKSSLTPDSLLSQLAESLGE